MQAFVRRAAMHIYRHRHWRPLERRAARPDLAQREVLCAIVSANRTTSFGREHGFAEIDSAQKFRERVPVQQYEMLRPYIERQRRTGETALTSEAPRFYAQTSGTTGAPKYIPITRTSLAMHRAEQALFSYLQFRACPPAFDGMAMGIMGAAVEGRLDSGHAVGSVSGHLYASLPRFIQSRFVVPPAVATISDYDLKYQVILHLALAQPRITYIGSPNPSTFLRLLDVLNREREMFLRALATGVSSVGAALDPSLQSLIASRMPAMPERAAQLAKLPELTYANVWPEVKLLTTWTGGSCGIALGALRNMLPRHTVVMELGYQATEVRGTIPLEAETPGGLPPLHHTFFEFVERSAWDRERPDYLTLDQLEQGFQYYVLVTSAAGLYRYFMNDLVEVTGAFHGTPLLRFVQKGKGVTNLTGEKLYEAQVIDAVQSELPRCGVVPTFFVMIADEEKMAYRLLVEGQAGLPESGAVEQAVDRRLGDLNIEYRAKRDSGRLAPLTLTWLRPGAGEAYKAAAVNAGQREGQLKPAVLQHRRDLLMQLDQFVA
jgi:GH3 auxin-responsive promoter